MTIPASFDTSKPNLVNDVINNCEKQIEIHEKYNKSLDNMIKHVENIETEKGYLRRDKNNMPCLKKELTIGTLLVKLHFRKETPENIRLLETNLKFGKMTSRKDIILNLENRKRANDQHIEKYREVIKLEENKSSTSQKNQINEPCKTLVEENHFTHPNRAQPQEGSRTLKPPSLAKPENPVPGNVSTSLASEPETMHADASKVPTRRAFLEHLIDKNYKSKIFDKILKLQCEKLDAERLESNLSRIKEQFNSAQPSEGYLRFSNERGLYLSENASIREAFRLHDGGASKLQEKIPGLDLGVGEMAKKTDINDKIDNLFNKQKEHIRFLEESIERHKTELALLKAKDQKNSDA